ncbi:MAG: hypothetical protein CMJ46_03180 [Planctomyces sp.]|nr:hypothetical protein [Planctomyces sp.]
MTGSLSKDQLWELEQAKVAIEISKQAQTRFHDRRSYEWKIAFTLWGGLASFLYLFLSDQFVLRDLIQSHPSVSFILIIVFLLAPSVVHSLLHIMWLQPRLAEDKNFSFRMEVLAFEKMSMKGKHDYSTINSSWPMIFQIFVTGAISIAIAFAICSADALVK